MKWLMGFILALLIIAPLASAEGTQPNADPHQQLNEILQRPMYRAWQERQEGRIPDIDLNVPTGFKGLVKRVTRAIGDFLQWLFRSRPSSGWNFSVSEALPAILRILAWLVVGVALTFCAVFLIRWLGKAQLSVPIANILSRQQVHHALESGDALAMNSAQWLEEARRLAEEENFRAVYRALYLALLSGLHTLGKIEHSRNRTNWTYVQHFRGPSDERGAFADLTELFDRVWYGRKQAVGYDLEQLRRQVAELTKTGEST